LWRRQHSCANQRNYVLKLGECKHQVSL
jgi:hypothetical protein